VGQAGHQTRRIVADRTAPQDAQHAARNSRHSGRSHVAIHKNTNFTLWDGEGVMEQGEGELQQLADRIADALRKRGPQSHQQLACMIGTDVTEVNDAVISEPSRFVKIQRRHGRLRQTETFVAVLADSESVVSVRRTDPPAERQGCTRSVQSTR
jgi:hypothetical protein